MPRASSVRSSRVALARQELARLVSPAPSGSSSLPRASSLPRSFALAACAYGALALASACRGPAEQGTPAPLPADGPLTVEQVRQLISQGALKPVDALGDENAFADPKPDRGPDPFEKAVRKVAAEEAQRSSDAPTAVEARASEPHAQTPETSAPAAAESAPANATANTSPATPAASNSPTAPAPSVAAPEVSRAPAPTLPTLVDNTPEENPYLVFGKRIVVYKNGLIMKPYPLRPGSGEKLQKLLETYGNFKLYKEGVDPLDAVRLELLKDWDQEQFGDLRQSLPKDEFTVMTKVADWLVVTARASLLREVEDFINVFAAGVPQIEIEAKIVEVTTTDTLDLGVKPIDTATPIFGFPDHTFVQSFSYNLPNTAGVANSLLALSSVQDGVAFNAILQALQTYDNVSIISRPKIAVREGGTAKIVNTLKLPSYNVSAIQANGQAIANLYYEEVGVKLYVVPRVVGTQTVALNIDIEASQQSGNSVSVTLGNNQTISNPIISKRAAQTVVYLEPGQAVILGGLVTERTVDTENKVPILGSIPLVGYLFKSTFKRKEQANVLFFIRPRILTGSDLNREF